MNYYIGIDIGGTKIAAATISAKGNIVARTKTSTPSKANANDVYACLLGSIDELLHASGLLKRQIKGIGLGVPGIVDTHNSHILAAPNLAMTGFPIGAYLKKKFRVPIAMANDVNAGLLGEAWLGVAKGYNYVAGIFPGTGVGGAVIHNGHLILGAQGAATELGHMIIDIHGPKCHCGNYGCLEALASRWAIERDIRKLIKSGRKSKITQMTQGDLSSIKSRVLKDALLRNDAVVKEVITQASVCLGKASISINHMFNPQAIVFGGGIIKSCAEFMLPTIARIVFADPFFKKFNTCKILQSSLGDDAVPLGAVRLVSNLM